MLLLTNGSNRAHPEHTMVDGLIELIDQSVALSAVRELRVSKFRGSKCLRGWHSFRISEEGLTIYPRIEALLVRPSTESTCEDKKVSTGVERLDEMLHGGLLCGTTTMLLGPSGTGKTTLGLHFLSASTREEPGLLFGFYETPERLIANAGRLGLDLPRQVDRGEVEVLWQPPTEDLLDGLGERLLDAVRRRGVRRLFVDGLRGFQEAAIHKDRLLHFFTALANELRALGVTTVYTAEAQQILGSDVHAPLQGISSIVENLIVLRFIELRTQLYRVLSVMKVRGTSYDSSLREFSISERGIDISDTFESAEALLIGVARPGEVALFPPRKLRARRPGRRT